MLPNCNMFKQLKSLLNHCHHQPHHHMNLFAQTLKKSKQILLVTTNKIEVTQYITHTRTKTSPTINHPTTKITHHLQIHIHLLKDSLITTQITKHTDPFSTTTTTKTIHQITTKTTIIITTLIITPTKTPPQTLRVLT